MHFRLVYQGKLPAASSGGGGTRTKEKHAIRRALHKQLAVLWNTHPFLRNYVATHTSTIISPPYRPENHVEERWTTAERLAKRFERCGYRFFPLIGSTFGQGTETACALDILFLRRDAPGNLIESGGDIDNRIKVLFDALRMPQNCEELFGSTPAEDEQPFFCLLEDDKLIQEVKVTTDRLLTPTGDNEHVHDVHLIIHVTTLGVGGGFADVGFLGE